jgi:DNA-binding beta-propeller fold protein YncE
LVGARGITVDGHGDVYVADNGNGQFRTPYSVAAGPHELYVADTHNNRLQEFTFSGRFIQRLGRNGGDGTPGSGRGQFSTPYGVAVDCRGNLYVTDEGNDRVQVFAAAGGPPPVCPGP